MSYRNGNYSAFYVEEPFHSSNLAAHATKDFVSYNLLRTFKGEDNNFPFNDSHEKNYNVRDGSDWEKTLKPRLRERLDCSKNIILFLSSITRNSRALSEEIDYGINTKGLPIIVIYPELREKSDIITPDNEIKQQVKELWEKIPLFPEFMRTVPTLHIPIKKDLIKKALSEPGFMVNTKRKAGICFFG